MNTSIVHAFKHGGYTRKMLTLEIGGACRTRGIILRSKEQVLEHVSVWLDANGYTMPPSEKCAADENTREDVSK